MVKSKPSDSQLSQYGSKRMCPKMSHGSLEKTKQFDGSVVWVCESCGYKENEEGERI